MAHTVELELGQQELAGSCVDLCENSRLSLSDSESNAPPLQQLDKRSLAVSQRHFARIVRVSCVGMAVPGLVRVQWERAAGRGIVTVDVAYLCPVS